MSRKRPSPCKPSTFCRRCRFSCSNSWPVRRSHLEPGRLLQKGLRFSFFLVCIKLEASQLSLVDNDFGIIFDLIKCIYRSLASPPWIGLRRILSNHGMSRFETLFSDYRTKNRSINLSRKIQHIKSVNTKCKNFSPKLDRYT